MEEKAFKLFSEAWSQIKAGILFDEGINNAFDYMIKNLWKSEYKNIIKTDILKHLPDIYTKSKNSENPPPLFYVLISLRDLDIVKEMQTLVLLDWIKSNASELETYQLLNFIETFADKQIPIKNFVNTIINHITTNMNKEMIEAMSYMISIQHPEFMRNFLTKFLSLSDQDDSLLKNYVKTNGRKAFLALMQIATPEQMNKIFKQFKS